MKKRFTKYSVVALFIGGFVMSWINFPTGIFSSHTRNNKGNTVNLPSCKGTGQFTTAPVELDSFASIIPLGNLNPVAGHVTPTDHIYFSLRSQSGDPNDHSGLTIPVTVRSPGDVTLQEVQASEHMLLGKVTNDYRLAFSPCREMLFFYDHIRTLSPAIQAALDKAKKPQFCVNDKQGVTGQKMCNYLVSASLKSGDVIGTAGGFSFDFGGYDLRTPTLAFINKKRTLGGFGQYFHTICPLDYFSPAALKTDLYNRVKNVRKNSNGLPNCGTTMQDMLGTIQGNWYMQGSTFKNGLQRFDQELAIVHSNTDPGMGVISVGGTIAQAAATNFIPAGEGTFNREPSQVGADGNIYCYQDQYARGHFAIQLTDANHLMIEYQIGACSTTTNFVQPTIYTR